MRSSRSPKRERGHRCRGRSLRLESAEFYCECHDPGCGEGVVVPLDDHEKVRGKDTRFLHAPGHVERRFERVVARRSWYAIVEKFGRSRGAAPRSPSRAG